MPTNLEGVHSIIASFLKGHEVGKSQKDEQTRQKENADAIKREQERYQKIHDDAQAQQDIENKRNDAIMKASQAMQSAQLAHSKLQTQLELTKAAEAGALPPQYKSTGEVSGSVPISEGYSTTRSEYQSPDTNEPSFSALAPEDALRQQEEIKRKALEPGFENQLQLKAMEEAAKQRESNTKYLRDVELANIRGNFQLKSAAARPKPQSAADRIVPPPILRDVYGITDYDRAYTYNDLVGRKLSKALSDAEQAKLNTVQDMYDVALSAKQQLDQYGYENYFKGGPGIMGGLGGKVAEGITSFQGGPTDPIKAGIRRDLGKVADRAKKEFEGTNFTESEKPFFASNVPSPFESETPAIAKTKLEGFLADQETLIKRILSGAGGPNLPPTTISSAGPKLNETKKFENGNIGKWDGTGWVLQPKVK